MSIDDTTETSAEGVEEKKAEKKKLLIVAPRLADSNRYTFSCGSINFAFVAGEEHNRTQCTAFMTCREYINNNVLSHMVNKKLSANYVPGSDAPIDTAKLRLLIGTEINSYSPPNAEENFKQALFNAKAGINRYEELVGWKKSVICTVKHKLCKNIWMITSPGEWISQPQLLSMFVLLLRYLTMHPTIDTTDIESIHSSMIALAEKYKDDKNNKSKFVSDSDLEARFGNKDIINMYAFLIKNTEKLFKDIGPEKAWPCPENDNSFIQTSGIDKFIKREACYSDTVKALQDTFSAMWKQHKQSIKTNILKEVS